MEMFWACVKLFGNGFLVYWSSTSMVTAYREKNWGRFVLMLIFLVVALLFVVVSLFNVFWVMLYGQQII